MFRLFQVLSLSSLLFFAGCGDKCCDHDHKHGHSHEHAHGHKHEHTASAITHIATSADFEAKVLKSEKPVLVDFSAKWCGACQEMKPIIEHLATELTDITFVEVDIDAVGSIASDYEIKGVPTFLLFKNGKAVNKNSPWIGSQDEASFKENIKQALK
jgi:thioredoxin 1